jgi:hypothetical protein
MVPLTALAFYLCVFTFQDNPDIQILTNSTFLDWFAIPLSTLGVVLYTAFEEPPKSVLIEKF